MGVKRELAALERVAADLRAADVNTSSPPRVRGDMTHGIGPDGLYEGDEARDRREAAEHGDLWIPALPAYQRRWSRSEDGSYALATPHGDMRVAVEADGRVLGEAFRRADDPAGATRYAGARWARGTAVEVAACALVARATEWRRKHGRAVQSDRDL